MVTVSHVRIWIPLGLVICAAALVRIIYGIDQPVNMDEGVYLADARLIDKGLVPHVHFLSREPILLYLLSLEVRLFGTSLEQARLLFVLFGVSGTILVYLFGTQLFTRRAGLFGAACYAVVPFSVFQGTIIKLETLESQLVGLSFILLFSATKSQRLGKFAIAGFVLGVAVLTKRGAGIFIPIECVFIAIYAGPVKKQALGAWLGGGILASTPLWVLMLASDPRWILDNFAGGQYVPQRLSSVQKHDIARSASMLLFFLFFPTIVFISHIWAAKRVQWLRIMVGGSALFALAWVIALGQHNRTYGFGVLWTTDTINTSFVFLSTCGVFVTTAMIISPRPIDESFVKSRVFVSGILLGYTLFMVWYPALFVDYFMELVVAMSVATGVVFDGFRWQSLKAHIWRAGKHQSLNQFKGTVDWGALGLMGVLIGGIGLSGIGIYGEGNPYNKRAYSTRPIDNFFERSWTTAERNQVELQVRNAADANKLGFTGDNIFLVEADLDASHGINYPHHYILNDSNDPIRYDPLNLVPSVQEIALHLWEKQPGVVIEGMQTREIYSKHPTIRMAVRSNYKSIWSINSANNRDFVQVLKRVDTNAPVFSTTQDEWTPAVRAHSEDWVVTTEGIIESRSGSLRGSELDLGEVVPPVLVSVDVEVNGEGGLWIQATEDSRYLFRWIRSIDFVGHQIYREAGHSQELLFQKLATGAGGDLTKYKLQIFVGHDETAFLDGEQVMLVVPNSETGSNAHRRVGLRSNYGARFSDGVITNDPGTLMALAW